MASSSSSSISQLRKYGVFLSFRGVDTREKFVSHLCNALNREGIRTFIDSEDLERGNRISDLLKAIEDSNVALIVFSENYASSQWCLDELVDIMKFQKTHQQVVIPIFYHVNPDDVANIAGTFGEALEEKNLSMKSRSKLPSWRNALEEVADISGFNSADFGTEFAFIQGIVQHVCSKLRHLYSENFDGLVGMRSRAELLESYLCVESENTRFVGVWGMAGIGKTTTAEYVFEKNKSSFEGSCFLSNVREERQKHGLYQLQCRLLGELLNKGNVISTGHMFMLLRNRKVLIVLDDVDDDEQVEYLAGQRNWFGQGSKVIFTSRERKVLENIVDETCIFEVPDLSPKDALELFSKFAFRDYFPNYANLSSQVLVYAKGNPLALRVLGSFLRNKSKQEWESAFESLEKAVDRKTEEVLRVSYNGLNQEQREIFLHIACFLKGEPESYVNIVLDSCGFSTLNGLEVLADKALIIRSSSVIEMHDMLQEMGQRIVHEECTYEPGQRSRLWEQGEIRRVLETNSGTGKVNGIFLDMNEISEWKLAPTVFRNMNGIEMLKFSNFYRDADYFPRGLESRFNAVQLPEGLKSLPWSLRYLYWASYPLESLPSPSSFNPENLAVIDMPRSKVRRLWSGVQNLPNLKVIKMHRCRDLVEMPNFSKAPKLMTVDFRYCESLRAVSPSISHLSNLVYLILKYCKKIKCVPSTKNLRYLQFLNLFYCTALREFPEVSPNIRTLKLSRTAIEEVPTSIVSLSRLQHLCLWDCKGLRALPYAICELRSLQHFSIGPYIQEEVLNVALPSFSSLSGLTLCGGNFSVVPTSIKQLSRLEFLDVSRCTRLQFLPQLPPSIRNLYAQGCPSLQQVPSFGISLVELWETRPTCRFFFNGCWSLEDDARKNILKTAQYAIQLISHEAQQLRKMRRLHKRDEVIVVYPGNRIPRWFRFASRGFLVTIPLPEGWRKENFLGFSLCAVVEYHEEYRKADLHELCIRLKCQFKEGRSMMIREAHERFDRLGPSLVDREDVFLFYSSRFHSVVGDDGNRFTEASFEVFAEDHCDPPCFTVKSCAVQPLYAHNYLPLARLMPSEERRQ